MRREVERLRSEVEEATREAEVAKTRAKSAEEGAENLDLELSEQNNAAELQMLRALAEQQRKWETRERRLEQLLAASQRQQQLRERSAEADMLNQGEREELVPVMAFERRISELQEQLLTSQEERRQMATDREPRADRRQLTETGAATDNRVGPRVMGAGQVTVEPLRSGDSARRRSEESAERERVQRLEEEHSTVVGGQTGASNLLTTTQIAEMMSSLTQQLPGLPEFTGEEVKDDSFAYWLERFKMMAKLARWDGAIKLKQLVLRLRGAAQGFYRTCTEAQKASYSALVAAMKRPFTPVRIQALECSVFHERKQGSHETVDKYAQDLQRLFQKAYTKAALSSDDALEMGQAVLSSQFVGGLTPDIKRKMAYLEEATFAELWPKARYEEARLKDLSKLQREQADTRRRQQQLTREDQHKRMPQGAQTDQARARQEYPAVRCYKCHQPGRKARECRS